MAFDLNKNDGSVKDSSSKKPVASKFDLSKGEVTGATIADPPARSNTWIIGLVGLLIVGGGIWYYSASTNPVSTAKPATAAAAVTDSSTVTAAVPSNTEPAVKTPAVETVTAVTPVQTLPAAKDAAKLNNKIPATFGQGSTSFKRIDQSLFKRIISYLTDHPNASIQVNGYASSDGSLAVNQTISQARADAFKKYLVSKNVAENRVAAVGKGIENPIAPNNTNAGRKKNRRVEITLP